MFQDYRLKPETRRFYQWDGEWHNWMRQSWYMEGNQLVLPADNGYEYANKGDIIEDTGWSYRIVSHEEFQQYEAIKRS